MEAVAIDLHLRRAIFALATDDKGAHDQKNAAGFIKLNALRPLTLAVCATGRVEPGA